MYSLIFIGGGGLNITNANTSAGCCSAGANEYTARSIVYTRGGEHSYTIDLQDCQIVRNIANWAIVFHG